MFSNLKSTANNAIDEESLGGNIRPATLIQLHKLGFKLVPLSLEHHGVMSWTTIYEDSNFWSPEKIVNESLKFKNVATVFGKSPVKDEKGLELHLNVFDGDSQYAYQIINSVTIQDPIIRDKVQNLITKSGSESLFDFLIKTTAVVKTRKEFGYQFYWLSHTQNPRVRTEDCMHGREFEIKPTREVDIVLCHPQLIGMILNSDIVT
jgi:hypothetical protein